MSKKILFVNSAKLTTTSLCLLLVIFGTIGMSFTPGEEGENLGNPNDSTYITGPRRSHWHWETTANCSTTPHYQSSVDYAETKVQTRGNGSATISTTETANVTSATSASTTTTAGNTASISWNSGLSHGDKTSAQYTNEQIANAHKKEFTLTAEPINADYYFLGWGTSTSESSIVSADNPYTVTSNMGITGYTDANSQPANYATNTYTETYYAFFRERLPANITLKLPTNGTVKYSYESYSNVTLSAETTITTKADLTLVAVPDENCRFYGWYTLDGTTENFISTSETYTRAYPDDITIYAKFVPNSQATFTIKGTDQYFYDLGQACAAAASSSSKIVYPIADGTVPAGNYTIPSGVTLLIPYEGTTLNKLTAPAYKYFSSGTPEAPSCYRKLILLEGANITCNGTICVAGQIASLGGGSPSGYPFGACGVLDMSNGGHIELNSNSTLYAWGFIKGQDMDQGNNTVGVGTITANAGSTVYEDFCGENRGGSACSALASDGISYKSFPFQGYAIQNIEVPVTYKYQSTLKVYASLYIRGDIKKEFPLISSSGSLFLVQNSTSQVRKWYDPTTDLACYELSGTAKLDAINTTIYVSVNSADFNLPISSNMHIILDNCTMTLSNPVQILPDAVIEIKANSTATISSNMFMYDKDDWKKGIGAYYFASFKNLTSHKNRGDGKSNATLDDAKLIVDGTLNVTGKLYSTTGGANICGSGGGTITFSSLPTASNIYQCWGAVNGSETYEGVANVKSFSSITGGKTYLHAVAVNSANLHNEDGSYTQSAASSTFHNVNGRWFAAANKDENESTHVYDHFIYISDGQPVSGSSGSTTETKAVYAPDKTGIVAGMKWCNVAQDATCNVEDATHSVIYNATQDLNGTAAANIRYTYQASDWLQLLRTETEGVYGGSDNSLYAVDGCAVNSLGSVDENCLYTINDVKKALVDGHFVALEKNTEDEAWHDVANTTNYYISFAGCTWHQATKYAGEEKAYIVEDGNYIWYNNDWLLVERESGMFFDYNEQNVKRYYEYVAGAWVLATPFVRVTDAIETRDFYKLPEAIAVASGKKNTTITILKDISGINTRMTYSASNTTCTLDLNGHTVSGAAPFGDDNNRGLLIINASGTTFTITDNSANKEGRLENICNQNKVTYTVHLMAGTLNVEHGTIHAENPAQYASKAATVDNVAVTALTACGARGIQVNAAQKLNISGGRLEAYATRNAYGIVASGNAANTTQVTITDGEIYAEAPYGAYGISCSGKLNISGGLVEAKLNDHLVDASYAATNASYNLNKHQECYAIHMSASANKTASSCYYGTLTVTGGTIKASSDLVRSYTSNVTGVRMYYSVAGMGNRNFASTSGTNAQQACAIGSVKNAEIIVQNNANYGYGIMVYGHYNSYNKTNSIFKVENTTIDVKAYNYAYGVYALGAIDGTTGECVTGDVELTNCTVKATAEKAAGSYAAWVYSGATTIYQNKQANYYGEYAAAAKMTINGGTYTAWSKTTSAYAVGTSTRAKSTYGTDTSVETERTLGGNAEAYPTLIINGGTFNATSTTTTARGVSSGGNTTIKDATFNVVAGTTTAYGLYALSGKLTATNVIVNDTAKGRTSSSNNNAYAYGVLVDCSIPNGNTAQTGFAYAGDVELNNCTINAVTTTYDNARALYVNATNKVYNWTQFKADSTSNKWATTTYNAYKSVFPCTLQGRDSVSYAIAGTATVNGGTFTAKAGRASAYGAVSTQTSVPANKEVTASPEMTLKNATFSAQTGTSTTAYGVQAGGPTLIEGCTIEATAKTTTASGVRAMDKTITIKNSTITATATDAAYGLEGYVEINATHGYCFHGEFDLSEAGTTAVTAEAKTSGKKAYTIYLNATKKAIASGNFAGDYATAANATINGGTYVAKFNTSGTAYVISLGAKQTQGSVVAQPEVEVLDGFFNGATAEVGTAGVVGHMQLKGGYFVHPTNLATYAVAPKSVWTLSNTHEQYNPYKYKVTEHYNIVFMNGTTQLQQKDMEVGSIPAYTSTPTKDADAQYTYTFDGWSTTDGGDKLASLPVVSADATYFAHYSKTEKKYTVNVSAGEHGSVSPASVSGIGCETASADITATPNVGYKFVNWTLPEGVTAVDGYTVTSNPIRIHATAADKTITANFVARTDINYTVKHWQQNIENDNYTEVTADQETKKGTTATLTAATAKTYTGFTALPITQETIAGNGSTIVNIYYNRNTFTITWLDGNGTTIETDEHVKYGATPSYGGETPTKTATAQYTYAFNNTWSPAITTVSAAATYTAQFNEAPRSYSVTLNTNEGTINSGNVTSYTYGTDANLPTNVTRTGYDFNGWYDNSECTGEAVTTILATATGDKEYWAKWSEIEYTITWLNWNGDPLKDPTVQSHNYFGETPAYSTISNNPIPTREPSDGKTYEWDGWATGVNGAGAYYAKNNLPKVTGDATYYAHFRITAIDVAPTSDISIDENAEVTTTTVRVEGKLNVSSGTLTTGDLIVEASSDGSGTIDGIERVTVTGDAYFDYKFDVDPWHWSAFGVPFEIDLDEAAPLKERTEELAILGRDDYDIVYYDTEERAAHGASKNCWKYVDNETHRLIPGRLYMIAFDKHVGHVGTVRFKKAPEAPVNYTTPVELITTGSAEGNNNWNGIANPMMYHALLGAGVTECQVHDGGEIGKDGYYTYNMTDKKFFVGKAAFVQVPQGQDLVVVTPADGQDPLHAPRRAQASMATESRYDIQIAPADGAAADRLLILAEEDKADEYVIVSDLAKAGVSPVRAQMWVDRYGEKLCKNTTAYINNKANYPLVISAPVAGEYEIFINEMPDDETMLYLTYNGKAIWNLSYSAFVADMEKGTTNNYGLRIVRTRKAGTGIEETTIQNGDAVRKVIVDNKVYIIRNGEIYSITGQKAK